MSMTHDQLKAARRAIEGGITLRVHSVPAAFEPTPGVPDDPDNPKASEGMEAFRSKVYEAIDKRGWNIYSNAMAEHDFIVVELYDSSAICQDTLDGKYYRIPLEVSESGEVSLGEPEEYDITYTPADQSSDASDDAGVPPLDTPGTTVDDAATNRKAVLRWKGGKVAVLSAKADGSGKRPTYRVLLIQSGFTQDGRYITRAALEDAVARGLFDGVKCYYDHPDPDDPRGKRPGLPCGFVKPGTVTLEDNKANEVDVWGDIALLATDVGNSIRDVLDASLEIGIPLLGNSVYSKEVWQGTGQVHGRTCVIYSKFEAINAVDFVSEAAFPRASVKAKLAAAAQGTTAQPPRKGTQLTMDEKQELISLRKEVAELKPLVDKLAAAAEENKKKAERLDLERQVDAELAASGLPKEDQELARPVLLAIADPDLRAAHLGLVKRAFWRDAKAGGKSGNGGTDGGAGNDAPKPKALSADVQAAVDRAAKAVGIKPELLEKAQLQVMGAGAQ